MSIDLERIAALLHIREKLVDHPKLMALVAHVDAELNNHNAEATKEDLPEPVLTKEQEAAAEKAKAEEEARAEAAEKAAEVERQAQAQKAMEAQNNAPSPAVVSSNEQSTEVNRRA